MMNPNSNELIVNNTEILRELHKVWAAIIELRAKLESLDVKTNSLVKLGGFLDD